MNTPKIIQPDISIMSTFFDEVRQEANGKVMLLGIYTGEMIVERFPVDITQLMIQTVVMIPATSTEVATHINYEFPDGSVQTLPVEDAPLTERQSDGDTIRARRLVLMNTIAPLQVPEPGLLRVRVDIGGKRYAAGALKITTGYKALLENLDNTVDMTAVQTVLGYLSRYRDVIAPEQETAANRSLIEILKSIAGNKMKFELLDPSQPVWIIGDRTSIWVLKTQPWQTAECLTVEVDGEKIPFESLHEDFVSIHIQFKRPVSDIGPGFVLRTNQPVA